MLQLRYLNMVVNCNEGTLNTYVPSQSNPWNVSKVLFLFRRIGFSIKFSEIKDYLNIAPSDLIDQIFLEAVNKPITPDPGWANFDNGDFNNSGKNRGAFFRDHQKIVFTKEILPANRIDTANAFLDMS